MRLIIDKDEIVKLGSYYELFHKRDGFQKIFCDKILGETGLKGKVLDIGCGANFPRELNPLLSCIVHLDGVDPSPDINMHPLLKRRWQEKFEMSSVPSNEYDLAFAYNVVEHVENAMLFMDKAYDVLKPSGVFWLLTPHANHPFVLAVKFFEFIGIKSFFRRKQLGASKEYIINDYPSYYRLNSKKAILSAITNREWRRASFFYFPCMQWDQYLPPCLRWIAHVFDYALGIRTKIFMLLIACRLEK